MAVRKQRIDKYYMLAKEKGYRARSAFKLLEIHKKYGLLSKVHIAVDLCAAPGGWMQILSQVMPTPRKIIGVDLDPIKPLGPDTTSFIGDIRSNEARKTLLGILDGHLVDAFVHDGAPNFGSAKEKDMFVQNDLVLHALKLSTEFLKEGGIFVTKIFRSDNFMVLINLLRELFGRVDITKPMSSRDESAEIFAVCRGFKNPEYIDPRCFDSNFMFECKETKYIDKYQKIKLSEYILSGDESILENILEIIPDFECELITDEMRDLMKDLKLLSKKEIKQVMMLKERIAGGVKKHIYDIPELESLKEPSLEKADEVEEKDKMQLLHDEIEKKEKEDKRRVEVKKLKAEGSRQILPEDVVKCRERCFFSGNLFRNLEMETEEDQNEENEESEEVEVSTCSDSLEMTEDEMKCLIDMKEKGEEAFVESTIDRHMVDDDDIALEIEKRPVKLDEFPNLPKKKMEYVGRKKRRAIRRAEKKIGEIQVEDEEEEAVIYKKIYKNLYGKQRRRLQLLFPKKKCSRVIKPRGKGKVKCLDKRMKHDLLIEKRKKKARK